MAIHEYLYVDSRRLDSYLEQIGPPVTYDKVPIWHAEISLSPKAKATQERRGRTLTQHEKVEALLKHLKTEELVYNDRPALPQRTHSADPLFPLETYPDLPERRHCADKHFVFETCPAVRFEVPGRLLPDGNRKKLSLWVSLANPEGSEQSQAGGCRPGILCLLEDFRLDDAASPHFQGPSALSVLWAITESLGKHISDLVLTDELSRVGSKGMDKGRVFNKCLIDFAKDPIVSLKSWGCIDGPLRRIHTLYRIREYGVERGDALHAHIEGCGTLESLGTSIFGYPIVIWEAEN